MSFDIGQVVWWWDGEYEMLTKAKVDGEPFDCGGIMMIPIHDGDDEDCAPLANVFGSVEDADAEIRVRFDRRIKQLECEIAMLKTYEYPTKNMLDSPAVTP